MANVNQNTSLSDGEYVNDYDYDYIRMTPEFQIPAAIGISILITLAVCGNSITIYSFATDKILHTAYDSYIFNLAIADLLIGSVSMPFYAVYTLKEFIWEFGVPFCKVWLTIDFTVCLESILLILLLSHDRLLLVTYGPQYQTKVTMKSAFYKIAISWMLAFLLYGPAIIGWDYWVGYSSVDYQDCDVEFTYNYEFTTATAMIEFVLPVLVLAMLNFLLYRKIRKRITLRQKSTASKTKATSAKCTISVTNASTSAAVSQNIKPTGNEEKTPTNFADDGRHATVDSSTVSHASKRQSVSNMNAKTKVKRDFKAARVLAIIIIVFLVCWAPYTFTTIVVSFCGNYCLNTSVYESMNWLLWSKSAINPFLYAMNSSRYMYNFKKILICWRKQNRVYPNTTATSFHA